MLSRTDKPIPLIPGFISDDQNTETLVKEALKIGNYSILPILSVISNDYVDSLYLFDFDFKYIWFKGFPVLLKAAAGGGGKGMRIVRDESELRNAIDSAKTEVF